MVQPKKFRGVRQRQWGTWVSEIRHPLLKKRVWLGTFDTAEEAAKAYDQAAILISGKVAKTNFPTPKEETENSIPQNCDNNSFLSSKDLSDLLSKKLRKKCCKDQSPSLTCLRLDSDNSHIGVWQKGAGPHSDSNWIIRVEFGKKHEESESNVVSLEESTSSINVGDVGNDKGVDEEEDSVANMQMIEELLDWNYPCGSSDL